MQGPGRYGLDCVSAVRTQIAPVTKAGLSAASSNTVQRSYLNRPTFTLMTMLPRKGLLAIAAVVDVALQTDGRPISAKTLATRHGLPPRHLESVLQSLVRVGILKSIRGPRGGYELARDRRGVTA